MKLSPMAAALCLGLLIDPQAFAQAQVTFVEDRIDAAMPQIDPMAPRRPRPGNPGRRPPGRRQPPPQYRPAPPHVRPAPPNYRPAPPRYRPAPPNFRPGHGDSRPGWRDGWRHDRDRRPRWWRFGIRFPRFVFHRNVQTSYWQCMAFDSNRRPYTASGRTESQAAYNAMYDCGGSRGADECYIPEGYCNYRYR